MPDFELPQVWDDLTKKQAQQIFDEHVAGHSQRVDEALAFLREIGVESDALDFTSASLEVLWITVLRHVELPDSPEKGWHRSGMPTWAAFRPESSQRLGRRNIEIIEWIAAYFNECVLRADSRTHWRLGDQKNAEGFREPLLVFPSGADMLTEELVRTVLTRALVGDGPHAEAAAAPDGLRRHMDLRLALPPSTDATESTAGVLFEIHPDGPNAYHVTYAEEVDDDTSAVLDTLVRAGS